MERKTEQQKALLCLTKETPQARKRRLAEGKQYRPAVFDDKKRRAQEKARGREMREWQ